MSRDGKIKEILKILEEDNKKEDNKKDVLKRYFPDIDTIPGVEKNIEKIKKIIEKYDINPVNFEDKYCKHFCEDIDDIKDVPEALSVIAELKEHLKSKRRPPDTKFNRFKNSLDVNPNMYNVLLTELYIWMSMYKQKMDFYYRIKS